MKGLQCIALVLPLLWLHAAFGYEPNDSPSSDSQPKSPSPVSPADDKPDWMKALGDDPLLEKKDEQLTLDDLKQALADKKQQHTVIQRHFARAKSLTPQQQEAFLRGALKHQSLAVRRQAAQQLDRLGLLERVVGELLHDLLQSDRPELREAAVLALERIQLKAEQMDEAYLNTLVELLVSDDPQVKKAAETQLESLGAEIVPVLLPQLKSDDEAVRKAAAVLLGRIVGSRQPQPPETKKEPDEKIGPAPQAKSDGGIGQRTSEQHSTRKVDDRKLKIVRVFFGTNRQIVETPSNPWIILIVHPVLIIAMLGILYLRYRPNYKADGTKRRRSWFTTLVLSLACLGFMGWSFLAWNDALRETISDHRGVEFGPRRNDSGAIQYGYCDVSIPPNHEEGEVEQPLIGPENESRHVVVKRTAVMSDERFYESVRSAIARSGASTRDCFVFVHGYNVSFKKAARRTAQIHHDLKFKGAPLFYSWPSRGSFRHYFSDRNEIRYSRQLIKQFLVGVHENVKADRIHVIAHSMGADAVCQAINEMDPERHIFAQIILAAPDIDADVFKQQIVPQLTRHAHRTTMYCSRNDWALHASYVFNDTRRAGDSSGSILVAPGVDTIDASDIDTELLGHSYYGDCVPMLKDVSIVIERDLSPDRRKLLKKENAELLPYWAFDMRKRP